MWPDVWSSMSQCAQKKAKQQWDTDKPKIQAASEKRELRHILPDEVEELDAVILIARKKLEIPVEPTVPWVTRIHITTAKTQKQKVAVSKEGKGETLASNKERLYLISLKRAETEELYQVKRMIGGIGDMLFCSQTENVYDPTGSLVNLSGAK